MSLTLFSFEGADLQQTFLEGLLVSFFEKPELQEANRKLASIGPIAQLARAHA